MLSTRSPHMQQHRALGGRPFRPGRALCPVRSAAPAAVGRSATEPHLQLATARVPPNVNPDVFAEAMYQWAATMTQSGANFPFALPLKADRLPTGFQISLLKRSKAGGFGSAGDIVATVEDVASVGPVLMVRFMEGPCANEDRSRLLFNARMWRCLLRLWLQHASPADATERLEVVLNGLVDVNTIMGTMPNAIRNAAARAAQ